MTRLLLAIVLVALPFAGAMARETAPHAGRHHHRDAKSVRHPDSAKACAAYGAGFVRVPGTNTCVRLSGSVSVDVGVNGGR
ncbi:MAG TPA: porin [Pseudolabrys sp.]|nr:porin [Pseudolabrys sp.]